MFRECSMNFEEGVPHQIGEVQSFALKVAKATNKQLVFDHWGSHKRLKKSITCVIDVHVLNNGIPQCFRKMT